MSDQDAPEEPDGPSLELPSLRLGRKRRSKRADPAPPPPAERTASPAPPAPPPPARPAARAVPATAQLPTVGPDAPREEREPARQAGSRPSLPPLGAVPATLVTGLLVGVVTVGLVWASQGACEVVRGTPSCGNAGFLLLLAVLVVAGLLGGVLLRAFGIPEGGSTSFLAMGLVAVIVMLVLGEQLFAWWMVLAVPVVAMVAYVLAHRVSTAMVEPGGPELRR